MHAPDLVRRRVAVIATGNSPSALAAKAVTTMIPTVFTVGGQRHAVPQWEAASRMSA
jgi:hypothetical protein